MDRCKGRRLMALGAGAALIVLMAGTWVTRNALAQGGSRKGGVTDIVVAVPSDAISIHPFDVTVITPDVQIMLNMYDPLIDVDRDGQVLPALAVSWERVSPTTLRFRLRRGVRFHNGEEFTADDVKFTIETILDPARKYKQASPLAFIDRVEVLDPWTVQLVTRKPEALALRWLSRRGIASARYARANPDLLTTRPNGTGSYRFVAWVKDDRLTMEAYDGGWRGAPAVRRVVWRPIREDGARVAALLAGEVDVVQGVPSDLVPIVGRSARAEIRQTASLRSYWLMMVNTRPEWPTAAREVRLAINHAIDRSELSRALFGGVAQPLATAVLPGSLGYNPALRWTYDPERARALLASAGYPSGFTIGLHASNGRYPRDRELSHALAGQLAKVGITVRVRNLEVGQFTDGIFKKTTDALVLYAFGDQDRDRTGNLALSHRSGQLWSVVAHPQLDELAARAEGTLDDGERVRVLGAVQEWMMENAPAAYLMTMVEIFGVNRAVRWRPRPDDGMLWREAAIGP